jgi:hypothetical protein
VKAFDLPIKLGSYNDPSATVTGFAFSRTSIGQVAFKWGSNARARSRTL